MMSHYPPEPLWCPGCGTPVGPGIDRCPRCQASLSFVGGPPGRPPPDMPPSPPGGKVSLIIAMVIGLGLFLTSVGVSLWLLVTQAGKGTATASSPTSTSSTGPIGPDDAPSASDGTAGSGASEQAARSLTAAFAALETSHGTEQFCDQAFAYGQDMVYTDRAECVDDWDGVFGHFSESERSAFAELTIRSSVVHAVGEDTLVVDWSEVDATARRSMISEALTDMGLGLVLQRTDSSDSWKVIGTTFDDGELGTVPGSARHYLIPDSEKSV